MSQYTNKQRIPRMSRDPVGSNNPLAKHQNCHFLELKEELKRTEIHLKELKLLKWSCLGHIKQLKEPIRTEKNFASFHFILFLFSFLLCLPLDYFNNFSYFRFFSVPSKSSFILRKVFNHQNRCSSTKLPGSTDQSSFRTLDLFLQEET